MSNRFLLYGVIIVGLMGIQASCKTSRVGGTDDCPKRQLEELTPILRHQMQKELSFVYAKVKVDVKDSDRSNSFNASVKMKPDSAFAGTVKVAGIIGAAYLVDQDTFAYKHKINNCFKKESFATLTKTFGTEVNYSFVQQLILGQAIGIENLETLYPLKNKHFYVIGSHNDKAFQRLEGYNLSDEEQNDIFIKYILDCKELKLVRIEINVPKDSVVIGIDFTKRQTVEGFDFPEETNIKIVTPEDSSFIDIEYTRISLNDPRRIELSIPDSYSECE
ncbi:MAG: DUF4292 domain-containing protein [Crocinitomicaceae bacterium]|nr:DUF4292 domain-containing protein [Crocinitomicaceae bacterium]